MLSTGQDITDRRRAEAQLRSLINTTQGAVISIDSQGRIVLFNPAAGRIFGYAWPEVQGQALSLVMPEPYASEHEGYIARYERTGEPRAIGRIRTVQWRKGTLAMLLGLMLLGTSPGSAAVEDQRAREIVDQVDRLLRGTSSIGTVTMQISTANWQRTLAMQIWSLGTENALIRVTKPEKEAGTATLKVANNIWHYLPKVNRTIKIPTSMMMASWMGSHFTNDDLVKDSRLIRDYFIALSFEGERNGIAVYEFTLTPKPDAAVVWGKIVLEVRQADLMPTRERYENESGIAVRELTFSEYKMMGSRLIPTQMVMRPMDKPGEQTVIVYDDLAFDVPISEDTFSLRNLER
ncbi:MAG: outer membrane lipoprotein-sorting protein [Deltaproteobacteria bacterium]|nr:outer membrane lipoprotein-sorting protein [Deltaproteobacteria bacterium]